MRSRNLTALTALSLAALLIAGIGLAQPKPTDQEKPEPLKYVVVSAAALQQNPDNFLGEHVQLPDLFGGLVDQAEFPDNPDLQAVGIASETHYAFLTNNITGSNMICFLDRNNDDAKAFFEGPLAPLTPIFIMGRVGRRIVTEDGMATVCVVDRVARGTRPPATKIQKTKSITFKVEYDVQTARGVVRRVHSTYKIPKPGVSYEIADPYNPGKKLYMTFDF